MGGHTYLQLSGGAPPASAIGTGQERSPLSLPRGRPAPRPMLGIILFLACYGLAGAVSLGHWLLG